MKRIVLAVLALSVSALSFAQTDSVKNEKVDTIKIGGMVIIKKTDRHDSTRNRGVVISNRRRSKPSNLTTNWWIVDLGFANFSDKTNYASSRAQGFTGAGVGEDQFDLRNGKSVNVNIWLFMQRLNLIKHVVNLKYGLGVELNNYRFEEERLYLKENPTSIVLDETYKDARKNKLAADYVAVPVMLNLNLTPKRKKGLVLSGGVSAGYLYSARQKINFDGDKLKNHDDFNLRPFKFAYIGELGMGPVRLYGSYATKSMWEKGLDQTPYNFGIRISSF